MIEQRRRSTTVPLGAAFFVVLVLFIGWSVTRYDGTFDEAVDVDVVLDSAGNALPQRADVKVRGVVVGHVDSTSVVDGAVVAHLAIEPIFAPSVSTDATARLLPKTLFGERYVSLIVPAGPVDPVVDGTVLEQDVSGNAIEVGVLLDGLLPLLQAIPPQDLANTLGALAQGLSGQGEKNRFHDRSAREHLQASERGNAESAGGYPRCCGPCRHLLRGPAVIGQCTGQSSRHGKHGGRASARGGHIDRLVELQCLHQC